MGQDFLNRQYEAGTGDWDLVENIVYGPVFISVLSKRQFAGFETEQIVIL